MTSNMAPERGVVVGIPKPQGTDGDGSSICESKLIHNLSCCVHLASKDWGLVEHVNGLTELLAARDDGHAWRNVSSHGRVGCRISQTWQPEFFQVLGKFLLFQPLQGV